MINLGINLSLFAVPGGLSVTRTAPGIFTNGIYTKGSTSTVNINPIVIYNSTGLDLQRLPEGQITDEVKTIFTIEQLNVSNEPSGIFSDIVHYKTFKYLVITSEDWDLWGYYKSLAVRMVDT